MFISQHFESDTFIMPISFSSHTKTLSVVLFFLTLYSTPSLAGLHKPVDEQGMWIEDDDTSLLELQKNVYTNTKKETVPVPEEPAVQVTPLDYLRDTGSSLNPAVVLAAHNRWREAVSVPPLTWSDRLAQTAQSWADYLSSNGGCLIQHSNSGYGENIFQVAAICWSDGRSEIQKRTVTDIIDGWASEETYYDYPTNSCADNVLCGHYKQIVWKNTKEVGCGVAVCPSKKQIWVCHYNPPGNVAGQRPY
jgi:pathogenesis-related protein 1